LGRLLFSREKFRYGDEKEDGAPPLVKRINSSHARNSFREDPPVADSMVDPSFTRRTL